MKSPNYIGGLVAAWTSMNNRSNKNNNKPNLKFVKYWLLFCFSFLITLIIIKLI